MRWAAPAAALIGAAGAGRVLRRLGAARRRLRHLLDRVDDLAGRLNTVDQGSAGRAGELAAQAAALGERQTATEARLGDLALAVASLTQKVDAVASRTADVTELGLQVEGLERAVAGMQEAVDRAGAQAATAVAAADEIEAVVASLRELRADLLRVARQLEVTDPAERLSR